MGNLADYQARVDAALIRQSPPGKDIYWPPFVLLACVSEEVGEISRELNHLHGPKQKKPEEAKNSLGAEIGDAIFSLICLANAHKIDLDDHLKNSISKCTTRDLNRFKGNT